MLELLTMFQKSSFQNLANEIPLTLSLVILNVWSEQEPSVLIFARNIVASNGRLLPSWQALTQESTITIGVGVSEICAFTITFVSGIAITLEVIGLASSATPASVASEAVVPQNVTPSYDSVEYFSHWFDYHLISSRSEQVGSKPLLQTDWKISQAVVQLRSKVS
ncbi:unnamed protein product [Rodentolepis nana]|uniref:Neur_chan_LBD domain-containing protein n=1 Tax=Rodentolepis nana TaxID=102285 RepID=A0A0R3T9W8_RODNA|nr:unnamed protein product [Rodentolepis nana]